MEAANVNYQIQKMFDSAGNYYDEEECIEMNMPVFDFVFTVGLGEHNEYGCDDSIIKMTHEGEDVFTESDDYTTKLEKAQKFIMDKTSAPQVYILDIFRSVQNDAREQSLI